MPSGWMNRRAMEAGTKVAFSESLKLRVRKRAHSQCCMCEAVGVDIHHVIPQKEGGPDTEENAAPLCPNCHRKYGDNRNARKLIRERREVWYRICEARIDGGTRLAEFRAILDDIPTKADLQEALRDSAYVLGGTGAKASLEQKRFSFVREEFVHPLIVRELRGWISDRAETITSIDLASANRSNRFFGEFSCERTEADDGVVVGWEGEDREWFRYRHVGTSMSGVEIVKCFDCGGGSGVFTSVGLFSIELDRALDEDAELRVFSRPRTILRCLGWITLGDRYKGQVAYSDGFLSIGPDEGRFRRTDKARLIAIR